MNNQLELISEMPPSPYDENLLAKAVGAPALAIDIETDTDYNRHKIGPEKDFGLSYCAPVTVVALAFRDTNSEIKCVVLSAPFDEKALNAVQRIMRRTAVVIAHNAVFDMRGLSKFSGGATPAVVWDTMIMARMLSGDRHLAMNREYHLLDVADVLGIPYPPYMRAMKKQRKALHLLNQTDVAQYGAEDAILAFKIYEAQQELAYQRLCDKSEDSVKLANAIDFETELMAAYCEMAAKGVRLNESLAARRLQELYTISRQASLALRADGLASPNSPKDRSFYIYVIKRIPPPQWAPASDFYTDSAHKAIKPHVDRGETPALLITYKLNAQLRAKLAQYEIRDLPGSPVDGDENYRVLGEQIIGEGTATTKIEIDIAQLSTSSDVLNMLCGDESSPYYESLKKLADYIAAERMHASLKALRDHAALDGRVHSLIAPTTDTTRCTSGHPNLQNLKMAKASENDLVGDQCGILMGDDDDSLLVEIDYNNAENRIAAMIAGDDNFAAALEADDFHSAMAASYFGDQWVRADSAERKRLRRMGKAVTFGTAYGMGAKLLSLRLGVSYDEARALLDAKDTAFPWVAAAKKASMEIVGQRGYIQLWNGRKIWIPKPSSYKAWNYLCQGGVSQMIKCSIIFIRREFMVQNLKSRVALDEHDALIFNIYREELSKALAIAQKIMENVIPEQMNHRTAPPIRWIARADLKENANKWGKYQSDGLPDEIGDLVTDILTVSTLGEVGGAVKKTPQAARKIVVIFQDIDLTLPVHFPIAEPLTSYSAQDFQEALQFFDTLMATLSAALNQLYRTRLPLDPSGNLNLGTHPIVVVGDEIEVDIENWIKTPLAWQQAARVCDIEELIGVPFQELGKMAEDRTSWYLQLQSRLAVAKEQRERLAYWQAQMQHGGQR
jgi:DNA polymerase I-like protein with 3'-5' exonuclease and polymerase domains